ncbi:MAG: anthranilate synthase component I [archaeon]|nr:anthranilate synthase component I [archaeon]
MNLKSFPYIPPIQVFKNIHKKFDTAYILESVTGPKKLAQYSFIGFEPKIILKANGKDLEIKDCKEGFLERKNAKDPLQFVKEMQGSSSSDQRSSRLVGGAVGYVSYDAIEYWERIESSKNELDFPYIEFGMFDDGIVFDHTKNQAFYYFQGEDRSKEIESALEEPENIDDLYYSQPKVNIEFDSFCEKVSRIKEYIFSGDIFQAVLSKRYEFKIKGDLIHFYESLRRINPSPYMYFMKMGDRQIVGSSPEMLVRVDNGMVETFPIAGTRPKLKDKNMNDIMRKELLIDPKECAEHVMLVDLARNDIGKVCEFGSVHVPEFMEVHQYSHVQHIVSRVLGKLKGDKDAFDVFRGVFPAGTVTGAPKIRAMEIIDELEPSRRGPYAGAIGYFSYNGNADFAITIRTLVANKDKAYIQVGAGIVADSDPSKEWLETEYKAEALMKALKVSGRVHK